MCESVKGSPEGMSADALAAATAEESASFNAALAHRRQDEASLQANEIADAKVAVAGAPV